MTPIELYALAPLLGLSATIIVVMLLIAFWRNHAATCATAVAGSVVALALMPFAARFAPIQVTPLLIIDNYAFLFLTLILLTAIGVALLGYDYLRRRDGKPEEFYLLLLLASLGAAVLVCSTHFGSFVLGLELLGISLYAMISYPIRGRTALEAALKYLILSGVASALLFFGAALIYGAIGTLSFRELGTGFYADSGSARLFVVAGSALLLAGMGFKLSLVPFHMWTPDVYEGAPAPVTAFVATVSKGAIFALLLRFIILTNAFSYESVTVGLAILAIASMLVGNLLAVMQANVKRILAYSSIAHLGYLLVALIAGGIANGAPMAVEACSYFLIAYFITTLGAFAIVTILSIPSEDRDVDMVDQYEGLFWRRPFLASAFTAMLLSLAGIPLTVGFIGKFYVFTAGVQSGLWVLIGTLIVGSGIGLYYYLRIVFTMTKRPPSTAPEVRVPVAGGWVLVAATAALVVLGVYPAPVIDYVTLVVRTLV